MNDNLKDKKILITGATSGIGLYLSIHLAGKGAQLILIARSTEKLEIICHTLRKTYGGKVQGYTADLSSDRDWEKVLKQINEEIGVIDVLINNAGMGIFENVADSNWKDIDQMIQINFSALVRASHFWMPHFVQRKSGHIVNISSQSAKMATPKSAVYSATKHAVLGFSNALRMEGAKDGVLVTTVNLGPVKTNFFKQADPSGNYEKAIASLMLSPNSVARMITNHLFTSKREINLPIWMEAGSKVYQIMPSLIERLFARQFASK
ncbi:SDR family NAD(P)-dependent oxidoreductase [Halobacillus massiliensis]|uniref:SDR family NAD(P)-dependent oxidoreductase n=1 Tax=Halobacillus massiliensis TaxID=1926286 RepID=UPI0009E51ED1|nr:SDR family oxidoreductase [Halobacillus massiliensis]